MTAIGHRDRGAATLLALAMAGVLLMVGAALGVVGALVVAHRKAQSAADLAALAGAGAAAAGESACGAADDIARLNGAELIGCTLEGVTVTVRVRVRGPRWLGQQEDLEATARAGPSGAGLSSARPSSAGPSQEDRAAPGRRPGGRTISRKGLN